MERLTPCPGPTTIAAQLEGFPPPPPNDAKRPYVFTNFAETVDGHATIAGQSGKIGSETDTQILMALRACSDAVLVGAGTIRAERYGCLLPAEEARAARQRRGMPPSPLAVIVSSGLELPWECGLFSSGVGSVLIFTTSAEQPPRTATSTRVVRHPKGVDLARALRQLRTEHGVEGLLSEGGPTLHGALLEQRLVDSLFVTVGAKLAGGQGPRIAEGLTSGPLELELAWLLREGDELYARYAVRG